MINLLGDPPSSSLKTATPPLGSSQLLIFPSSSFPSPSPLSLSSSLCNSPPLKNTSPSKNSLPSPPKYPSTNTSQKAPALLQLSASNQHPAPPCQWICSNRKYTLLTNSQNISMPRVKLSLAPQFHHLLLWPPTTRRHVALWDCDTWQNRLPERWGPKWRSTIFFIYFPNSFFVTKHILKFWCYGHLEVWNSNGISY